MGLNDILFKRTKRKKYASANTDSNHSTKESSSDAPTESDDLHLRDPILHVNSSETPSIEVLERRAPAVVSPGPDLSDGNDRPPLPRGGSEDTEDNDTTGVGFRLPVDVQQANNNNNNKTPSNTTFRLVDVNHLFSAGHLVSSSYHMETDEDDSFYLSATDTEGGPSTLATEDRTVFPNLPSEDDFTASSRSALDTSSNAPLRFNPRTGASLVPELLSRNESTASSATTKLEEATKRQLEEAVRQINPIYPKHEILSSDSESSGEGSDDSRSDEREQNDNHDDDDDDSFYLSATDTEGPSSEFKSNAPLLPSLRLSSPTDSPDSSHDAKGSANNYHGSARTVASLMPQQPLLTKSSIEALKTPELTSSHDSNSNFRKPRAESPKDVATSLEVERKSGLPAPARETPVVSDLPSALPFRAPPSPNRAPREPIVVPNLNTEMPFRAPTSPNRAPRIMPKIGGGGGEGKISYHQSTPLKKLPAPARDVRRKKMMEPIGKQMMEPMGKRTSEKQSPTREKTTADWFDPFSFEEWADFGCSSNATTQPAPNTSNSRHTKGRAVEGLENLVSNPNIKSKKTSSSINSAPAFTHSTIRRTHKTTCNDSVTEVLKTLESTSSSRRSRSLSATRQAPKRPTRSSSRRKRSKSTDQTDHRSQFGVSSDLESLSSQSNRSMRSGSVLGGKNAGQHRSVSGTESCHSSGHSTKSHTSHISESSKSIAADLLRLERHLETIGGSRQQRNARSRVTIAAPPGKLGVFLENRKDSRGTVVTKVRPNSPLVNLIHAGDRILAIDGADVSLMAVSEITSIMLRTNDHDRTLTVLKTTEDIISECEV